MRDLIDIYMTFCVVGATTFGGGYAMLPILQREIVVNKKWSSEEQIMDFFALSQGLPGIIAVNVASLIGYRLKKIPGAIWAALGVATPSVIVITLIAAFLSSFQDLPVVRHAFAGVAVSVTALILNTLTGLWKKSVTDRLGIFLFAAVFLFMEFSSISPVIYVVAAAAIGVIYKKYTEKGGKSVD